MKKFIFISLVLSFLFDMTTEHAYATESFNLPDLGSSIDTTDKDDQIVKDENGPLLQKTAQFASNEAQQDFYNLTPQGMQSQLFQYGKGVATSALQSQADKLLSPYGHISTQISVDDQGSLEGSSMDYLIPWYTSSSNLFFSQFSAHNTDGRTIANFGAGMRHNLNKDWLIGVNAFYDYDITRNHRRAGFGTEAWTNYFKLSSNYYLPLSSWKDSPDIKDYEERPARGWDTRIQAYLPSYPQLGTSLVYEKYYGEQVALFGTDDLQKNPSAVTVGVDYTPVPMVTIGMGYKKGNSDRNEVTAEVDERLSSNAERVNDLLEDDISGAVGITRKSLMT